MMVDELHRLYIHIPFCAKLCHYCDFTKVLLQGQPVDDYIEALCFELKLYAKRYPPTKPLTSIYIGGGTPTTLSVQQLNKIWETVLSYYPVSKEVEWTMEVNPDGVSEAQIAAFYAVGGNRISLGVQTLNECLLKKIGRTHSKKEVRTTLQMIQKVGIDNISIDLMYGLPGQTLKMHEETLTEVLSYELPHYSVYQLILEPHTRFFQQVRRNKLKLPGDEIDYTLSEMTHHLLESSGLKRYEISNYAKEGYESCHNLGYWRQERYYGIGAGASGFIKQMRYTNHRPIHHYIKAVYEQEFSWVEAECMLDQSMQEEFIFLGLRCVEGIDLTQFNSRFSVDFIDHYQKAIQLGLNKGWFYLERNRFMLTHLGFDYANEAMSLFL